MSITQPNAPIPYFAAYLIAFFFHSHSYSSPTCASNRAFSDFRQWLGTLQSGKFAPVSSYSIVNACSLSSSSYYDSVPLLYATFLQSFMSNFALCFRNGFFKQIQASWSWWLHQSSCSHWKWRKHEKICFTSSKCSKLCTYFFILDAFI